MQDKQRFIIEFGLCVGSVQTRAEKVKSPPGAAAAAAVVAAAAAVAAAAFRGDSCPVANANRSQLVSQMFLLLLDGVTNVQHSRGVEISRSVCAIVWRKNALKYPVCVRFVGQAGRSDYMAGSLCQIQLVGLQQSFSYVDSPSSLLPPSPAAPLLSSPPPCLLLLRGF